MSENVFIPKMQLVNEKEPKHVVTEVTTKSSFQTFAQAVVVALFGLLPIFFVPGLFATLGFDKAVLVIVGAVFVVVPLSFLALRRIKVVTTIPITLGLFWMVGFAAFVSGMLSDDITDSLRGSVLEPQTASFFITMALAMTIPLVLQRSKSATSKALFAFGISATVILLYTVTRFLFGADFLPFDSFTVVTASPVGTFNDLAIFAGLVVLLSLVTLVSLPVRSVVKSVLSGLILVSLGILAIVNFFNIWIVVGSFGLLVLVYLFSRDTFFTTEERTTSMVNTRIAIAMAAIICVSSVAFIMAGDYLGQKIGQLTAIDYIEVRPSLEATAGILKAVYEKNAMFGIGANRFADAWRLHKDQSINETIFWDTDFSAGNSFVSTVFVNLGLLGGVLLVAFHIGLLYVGYRMLLRPTKRDPYWYYFGVSTFTAACFIWGVSYLYVPGPTILLLGALFTGLVFVAAAMLIPQSTRTIPLASSRQRMFFLVAISLAAIAMSLAVLFTVTRQYVAEFRFTKAVVQGVDPATLGTVVHSSFNLYPDERFKNMLAQAQLSIVASLLGVQNPSEEQQKTFLAAAELALVAAEEAVQGDPSDPDNHALLAGVFSNLAVVGVPGAQGRVEKALAEAMRLDPLNPGYSLLLAQLAARTGDMELARTEITKSLERKRNFTPAMYLSAQLDISEGNTEAAIATTRSIITLEPRNPTRYFQLGVLLSATNDLPGAIAAYTMAINLDPQYANARYLLALAYLNSNQTAAAQEQLKVVLETNKDNQPLIDLMAQVDSGKYVIPSQQQFEAPIEESSGEENAGITTGDVASDLVTPVNTIPENNTPATGETGNVPAVPETVVEPTVNTATGTTSVQ